MTGPLPNAFLDPAANALKTAFTHVGLLDGGAELAGGAPAYARQVLAYGATANGDWVGTATFPVPPGSTVDGVGFYTAGAGGAAVATRTLADPESYTGQGVYDLAVAADVD